MTKSFTALEIADALNATLVGDGSVVVARVAHPADITDAQDLALAVDSSLLPLLEKTPARAAVIAADVVPPPHLAACIVVGRERFAMAKLTNLFAVPVAVPRGIHPSAVIEPDAVIGADVAIGPFVYVGRRAVIGAHSVLHPQVYVGPDSVIDEHALIYAGAKIGAGIKIGKNTIIHFNASIGADGFSFVTPQMGSVESAKATGVVTSTNAELVRIASLGGVVLGDNVEIGANTSIDRGTIVATRVGNGTKIDNQVQVGHNVTIGENCLICGRVGIAGSAQIGNRVVLGGAVGVADHVKVGDDSIAMAMSGIAGNLPPKSLVMGAPAKPRATFIEQMFNIGRIKSLARKIEALTKRLDSLEGS